MLKVKIIKEHLHLILKRFLVFFLKIINKNKNLGKSKNLLIVIFRMDLNLQYIFYEILL